MKVKNRNYFNHSTNKHILKTATTLCRMPIKKDVTFKKKIKSVKIFVPPVDENDLYGLRNKIVEKKSVLKRQVDNTAFIKRKVLKTRNKIPKTLQSKKDRNVKKEILKENNKNESLNTSKTSLNTSLNYPKHLENITSISLVNSERPLGFDASDKLKILEMYYQLKSFDKISDITGVNVHTLRYWKKTEDSIRKKADKDNLGDISHSQMDFNSMIAEVKNEISLNKELPKRGRPKSSPILNQSLITSHIGDIVSDPEIRHSSPKKALEVPSPKRGRPRRSAFPNMFQTTTNDSNTIESSIEKDKQTSDDLPFIESPKKGRPKKSLILNNSMTKSSTKNYFIRGKNKELKASKSDSPTKRGRKKSIFLNSYLTNFSIRNKEQSPSPTALQIKNDDVNIADSPKKRGRKKSIPPNHHLYKSPIKISVLKEKDQEQHNKSSSIGDNNIDLPKKRGRKKSVLPNDFFSKSPSQTILNGHGDISIGSPKTRGRKKSLPLNRRHSQSPTNTPDVQKKDQEQRAKSSPIRDNNIDSPKKRGRKKSLPQNHSVTKLPSQTILHGHEEVSIGSPKKRGRKKSIITSIGNVIPSNEEESRDISSTINDKQLENTPKKRGRKKSLNPSPLKSPVRNNASNKRMDEERKVLSAKRGRPRKSEISKIPEKSFDITGGIGHQIDSPKKRGRKKSFNSDVSKSPNRKLANNKSTVDEQKVSPAKIGRPRKSPIPNTSQSNDPKRKNILEHVDQVFLSDGKKVPKRRFNPPDYLSKTAKKLIADSLKKRGKSRKVKMSPHSLSSNKSTIQRRKETQSGDVADKPDLVTVRKSNTRKNLATTEKHSLFIPEFKGLEEIVDEINKLSCIFDSSNCLNFLNDHFKLLSTETVSTKSYDNTSILAKTKLQDETFKNIITDFFYGEYKLLVEINHQFNQLTQKKYKNINKNLEELKNYFCGSVQRLQVLKQQLS